MLEFFGINKTNGENGRFDGADFASKTVDDGLLAEIDEYDTESERIKEKSTPSVLSAVLEYLLAVIAVICLLLIGADIDEIGGKAAIMSNPIACAALVLCLLGWLITYFLRKKKMRLATRGKLYEAHAERIKRIAEKSREALGVPSGAEQIDILSYEYRTIDGKNIITERIASTNCYIHVGQELLSIFDLTTRYDIPLASVVSVGVKKRKITLLNGWNKARPYNRDEYRDYKITLENDGAVNINGFVELTVDDGANRFRILFPEYEDALLKFLGLR